VKFIYLKVKEVYSLDNIQFNANPSILFVGQLKFFWTSKPFVVRIYIYTLNSL